MKPRYVPDNEELKRRRDDALLSLEPQKLFRYFKLMCIGLPMYEGSFWSAVHMARIRIEEYPDDVKSESRMFLMCPKRYSRGLTINTTKQRGKYGDS